MGIAETTAETTIEENLHSDSEDIAGGSVMEGKPPKHEA